MFKFFEKFNPARRLKHKVLSHNVIDATVMSRILGMTVHRQDFGLEEDLTKDIAPGVTWRRRRFRFLVVEANDQLRTEGLCVNEITLDSHAGADVSPCLAGDYSHLVDFTEIENAYWATTFAAGAIRMQDGKRETRLYLNLAPLFFDQDGSDRRELLHKLLSLERPDQIGADVGDLFDLIEHRIVSEHDGKFGIARYLPAFPASRLVQSSSEILAATNAGYFLNFPEEYDDDVSCLHQPVGGHMIDGRLVIPPWIERPGILHFENGESVTRLYGPADMQLEIGGLPPLPLHAGIRDASPHGAVWRSFDPPPSDLHADVAVISFSGCLLTSVEPARPGIRPPFGGGLVTVTGAHAAAVLQPDGVARTRIGLVPFPQGRPDWMVSSGPILVEDSQAIIGEPMLSPRHAGEFRPSGPPPTRFPYDTDKARAPRTAFGVLPSGGLKMVVVDGRRSGEHSCGLTLDGLAHLMQNVGCASAINLDGGGSSVMAIEGISPAERLRENSPYGVVNIPSDSNGTERIVPIFLTVRSR